MEFRKMVTITLYRKVGQSCLTLCDPMDCSLPGFSVHGIFQARVLEWVAISFARGSSRETQMYRTVFWTLWEREKERVGWFGRMALKHLYYHVRNESSAYVRCRIQDAWGWCTGMTQIDENIFNREFQLCNGQLNFIYAMDIFILSQRHLFFQKKYQSVIW